MAVFYGSQWKGVYNSSTIRYFRGLIEYEITETVNTYTINVIRLGLEKITAGQVVMESARTGSVNFTNSNGENLGAISVKATSSWTFPAAANSQIYFDNSGESITIAKTENTQKIAIAINVSKPSGNAWSGTSTGTLTISIPAIIRPKVSLQISRVDDTTANVTANVTSYIGDSISNFVFTYGDNTQTLEGGTIASDEGFTRSFAISGISAGTVNCSLQASGECGDSSIVTVTIPSSFRTLHFGGKGKSIAFGMAAAETDIPNNGRLDCAMDVNFLGSVSGAGVKRDLLWSQNPASTNAGAKTLSKAITNYDIIQVMFVDSTTDLTYRLVEVPALVGAMGSTNGIWNLSNTSNIYFVRRSFTLAATSITFTTGQYKAGNAMTTAKTNAGYSIPVAVYGVKY